jgi:hypothetical protein
MRNTDYVLRSSLRADGLRYAVSESEQGLLVLALIPVISEEITKFYLRMNDQKAN